MRFSNDRTIASPMWNFIYSINVDRSLLEIFMNSASFWRRDSSRMRNRIESTNFSRNSLRCENRESSRRACKMCRLVKEIFLLHMYAYPTNCIDTFCQDTCDNFNQAISNIFLAYDSSFSRCDILSSVENAEELERRGNSNWTHHRNSVRTHNEAERVDSGVETGQFLFSRYNNFSPWKNRWRMKRIPNDPGMEIPAIRVIPAVWCTRQWKRVAGEARGS